MPSPLAKGMRRGCGITMDSERMAASPSRFGADPKIAVPGKAENRPGHGQAQAPALRQGGAKPFRAGLQPFQAKKFAVAAVPLDSDAKGPHGDLERLAEKNRSMQAQAGARVGARLRAGHTCASERLAGL